jgi:aryl-alcohol dehydrogenase-like predicted oxidoreductase
VLLQEKTAELSGRWFLEYRQLGQSGLKISQIGLGANNFGRFTDEPSAVAIVNRALEAGINFIDTADLYSSGISEQFIGKAVSGKRHQVIIATKFGSPMGEEINNRGGSRHHILNAVENSLKRLQTDYIDLYQMHKPDVSTPLEETLWTLDDLVRAGKVRYIGCSNFAGWQLCQALWQSEVNHLQAFVTLQSQYNLIERKLEEEVIPSCQAFGVGLIPWGPLSGGFLTGKYLQDTPAQKEFRLFKPQFSYNKDLILSEKNFTRLKKWTSFAREQGHTMTELAIGWLLAKPVVSTVIAGARDIGQLEANVAAAGWKLTSAEVAEIDAIYLQA